MNSTVRNSRARAVADLAAGEILASVEVAAPPERRHVGFTSREACIGTYLGWETLFERLAERMARPERGDDSGATPRR